MVSDYNYVFILYCSFMKKVICLFMSLFVLVTFSPFVCNAQGKDDPNKKWIEQSETDETHVDSRSFNSPVTVLDSVKWNANKNKSDQVQNTKLDRTTSKYCTELSVESNFTITRTLCNIKYNIRSYLEYLVYIWLTAATIFIIRNWFQLVISTDRGKEIKNFEKNIVYIVVGVILLISFYYIIDIYVSVVKLVTE